jgi:5'-nucleotidase
MRILVSNDDGIYSPGIRALAEAAAQFGEVRIVAPDVEQSSMGAAITATRPLCLSREGGRACSQKGIRARRARGGVRQHTLESAGCAPGNG